MNEFESMLSTAMRDEAEEISMTVDMNKAGQSLDDRLDVADRQRRYRTVLAVASVAALVVLGGVAAAALRGHTSGSTTPATRPSAVAHQDPYFTPPFTMDLPAWVATNKVEAHEDGPYSWWPYCDSSNVCSALSVSGFDNVALGSNTTNLTYAQFLEHLQALSRSKVISIASSRATTVDGRPATDVRASSTQGKPLALGCASNSCQDVPASSVMRYVVIDMGAGKNPVVVFTETASANPDAQDWLAQLDTVTASMRFSS